MNTPRPPSSTPTAVGLVGLPELADPFRAAGLAVVGGKDFRGSATAIRDHIRDRGPLVVLAADTKVPGLVSWLDTTAANAPVVLLRTEPAGGMNPAGSKQVALPATIDEILSVGGMSALGGLVGNATVHPDGSVLPSPARTPPTAPPAPPPFLPSSPVEQEADPFADARPQAPAGPPPAAEAPAPSSPGWDSEPAQARSAPPPGWDPNPAQARPTPAQPSTPPTPTQGWDPEPAQTRSAPAPGWDPEPPAAPSSQGWDGSPETREEPPPADNHGWDAAPVRWDTVAAQPPAPPAWIRRPTHPPPRHRCPARRNHRAGTSNLRTDPVPRCRPTGSRSPHGSPPHLKLFRPPTVVEPSTGPPRRRPPSAPHRPIRGRLLLPRCR